MHFHVENRIGVNEDQWIESSWPLQIKDNRLYVLESCTWYEKCTVEFEYLLRGNPTRSVILLHPHQTDGEKEGVFFRLHYLIQLTAMPFARLRSIFIVDCDNDSVKFVFCDAPCLTMKELAE